jgi:hypothetical protein
VRCAQPCCRLGMVPNNVQPPGGGGAAEARRIARKLEFRYTPKHGSWLNVAECELAILASQCLARRLGVARSPPGNAAATRNDQASDGTSPSPRPATSSNTSTRARMIVSISLTDQLRHLAV